LGIGDWVLGPIPNPQSPIPNPQSPKSFNININNKYLINYTFKIPKIIFITFINNLFIFIA